PHAADGGALRRITIHSVETDAVSAAVMGLFNDIAGLGQLLSVERGAGDEQVFVVRTIARDHELVDLLAMHVERSKVSVAAMPAPALAGKAIVSGRASASAGHGRTVRVDADALRRLMLLARRMTRAGAASANPRS